jgi:hypothetical protein
MTAAMSGIGLVATWMASVPPPAPRASFAPPAKVAPAPAVVTPIESEAARLARGLDYEARLGTSARNPFSFGAVAAVDAAPGGPAEAGVLTFAPPATPAVAFVLAGIATDSGDGPVTRTAILSGAAGVRLVRVGDMAGAYRVAAIAADAVDLAGPDGAVVTLRLTP